ncbi:Nif3-like dinuclear metal center hexameric protein [bacterium]|nr:Nif3-like dinuclear metal center hexameric protein [bacterium]
MDKYEITGKIEKFAPLDSQENWDCSGWLVETQQKDISKIMLALTVTENVLNQAIENDCDMIISHHPLFLVPLEFKNIDIYCAHTNLDKADGGTTDTLISKLFGSVDKEKEEFLRYVNTEISIDDFVEKLRKISPNLRYTNNSGIKNLKKIAFCAGSGSDFINQAFQNGADAIVTGDLKFHTAIESPIVVFDIGHFESEIPVLETFEKIIGDNVEIIKAIENSPFIYP